MSKSPSLFNEILARRIPQYIGMYIAALWLAVEIADWMSEKFSVSEQFSTYVFVGMLSMLPMVILFAWGHGRPGKDNWSKLELTWLPINLVLAYFIAMQFSNDEVTQITPVESDKQFVSTAANSTVPDSQINEHNKQTTEVETKQSAPVTLFSELENKPVNESVVAFFWDNQTGESELDWMSFGAPWLLTQDLQRTPYLSVFTPYSSQEIIRSAEKRGFAKALNLPKALALQMASNQSANWMILGSIHKVSGSLSLTAQVYDVVSGNELTSLTVSNPKVLVALDEISKKISGLLHQNMDKPDNIIADLAISEHTSNDLEAIKSVIDAKNHVAFENDFKAAIDDLNQALEKDSSFAEANVLAVSYYRSLGDVSNALEHTKQALMLDYKVYQETLFALKANLFGMKGETHKAISVLENWVKVYPGSVAGLTALGRNYLVIEKLDSAKNVYEKLVDVGQDKGESLVNLGRIYRLEENKERVLEVLKANLEKNPSDPKAFIELAEAYKQFLMLDEAEEMYLQASALDHSSFTAEIGLAYVTAYRGNNSKAINDLIELMGKAKSDVEKHSISRNLISLYMQTGQIAKAKELNLASRPYAQKILDPINYLFTISGTEIELDTLSGELESAKSKIKTLQEQSKPPFDRITPTFGLSIYQMERDYDSYKATLNDFEQLLQEFSMPFYEQWILNWKGILAGWDGDYETALKLFDEALERSQRSFIRLQTIEIMDQILYAKAETLMDAKRHQDSIQTLDKILSYNPLNARANYLKAENHYKLKQTNKAKAEIEKAKKLWLNADESFIFLQKLQELESQLLTAIK